MSKERSIARDAGVVMALILLSRALGFVRERAIADVFGMDWRTDAFRLAFGIPDFMYNLLIAGGLNAAFIPVFTEYLAKGEEKEAWRLASTFFSLIVALLLAMVGVGMLFTPSLTPLVAYAYEGEQRALLITLIRFMFPAVFFTAMAGIGMGVHKSYQNFAAPMWGPILYNAAIIASTYLLGPALGIVGMAYGTVAGAMGNFAVQLPFVFSKARGKSLAWDRSHPGLKRVLRLMGPAVFSLSIFQLNFMIVSNMASGLAEGSPTALRIGQTMIYLPLGVFAMAVGTVILPSLSRLAARGETEAFRRTFSQGLRAVFFIMLPSAFGLAVLRVPLIRLLFQTGEFRAEDTEMAAYALLFFCVGVWAQAGVQVLTQVYYSLQETRTLVRVSLTALAFNTLSSLLFLRYTSLEHGGLALAYSLTAIVNMLNYLFTLRRKVGRIDGRRIARTLALSALASAVMAWSVRLVLSALEARLSAALPGRDLWLVAASVLTGVAVYGGMALLLRMEELGFVRQMIGRRRSATPSPS